VRRKTLIFLLLFVMIFVMAEVPYLRLAASGKMQDSSVADTVAVDKQRRDTAALDSVLRRLKSDSVSVDSALRPDTAALDSALLPDTAGMDSLQLAIWHHNKQIDDSLRADSINRQRKNGIDAPVVYSAEDSMTYEAATGLAHLYGKSHVQYENMDL
jgi:hypothetical protein